MKRRFALVSRALQMRWERLIACPLIRVCPGLPRYYSFGHQAGSAPTAMRGDSRKRHVHSPREINKAQEFASSPSWALPFLFVLALVFCLACLFGEGPGEFPTSPDFPLERAAMEEPQ